MIKLDYTLESPEERKQLVEKILQDNPDITPGYLEILADYLILCMEKQEKKEKKILTENRMATVGKRECSFEGLAAQMENGEDGIYSLISEDKNVIFQPKISITQHDLDTIPCLAQLRETINVWEDGLKRAAGTRDAYTIKKALIEMRKDQYTIKQAYQKPITPYNITRSLRTHIPLDDKSFIACGEVMVDGVSLMDPRVVSAILCNYSKLKEDSYDQFSGDLWYLIADFENVCDLALDEYPIYQRIVELKIDKLQNVEIQEKLQEEFGTTYSVEYISSLWRNKIPKLIAERAQQELFIWESEQGRYPVKTCSKCGQKKPANSHFFSKNMTSKDKLYSICKKCRNKKKE